MDFYIDSLKFKTDKLYDSISTNELKFKRINVFVGANNCGKTQMLREIMMQFDKGNKLNGKEILIDKNEIKWIHPDNENDLVNKCHLNRSEKEDLFQFVYMNPTFEEQNSPSNYVASVSKTKYINSFNNESDFVKLIKEIGYSLITYLTTDMRLQLAKPEQENVKYLDKIECPKKVCDAILKDDNSRGIINNIDTWFYKVFDDHTWLMSNIYDGLGFRYKLNEGVANESASPEKQRNMKEEYQFVDEQGDGMRAMLTMLCGIFSNQKPIILIDEPEAFLHPNQAYLFGRFIGEIIDQNRQVFVSTHSSSFLRGLFYSSYDDVTVTRLFRHSDNRIDYYELDNNKLADISKDNVSSTYNVLDGLFHIGNIVCEGDKDVFLYQSMVDKIKPTSDIHVIATSGWGGVEKATELYRTMNVRHAIILDCDCALDKGTNQSKPNCPIASIYAKYESNQGKLNQLKKLLVQLNSAIEPTDKDNFKNSLREFLSEKSIEQCFDDICNLIKDKGIFLTQEGQLEAWFKDDPSINSNSFSQDSKKDRYEKMLNVFYAKSDKELAGTSLGKFINSIIEYLTNDEENKI